MQACQLSNQSMQISEYSKYVKNIQSDIGDKPMFKWLPQMENNSKNS